MSTVQDIEAAVEQLAPEQRAQFRAWFEAFDAHEWDLQIEQDLGTGQLDWLAEEALGDLAAGLCTDR
ncbi:hypothetical protein KBY83_02360 [Cyanobium sp. WKJ7-Wakatipu]|uniref:hypothetical protein n=1 Tax=Cyanobium sp. WKJ7-Wakatipu TaxID=2823726 RepID=UPI0020CC410A|nr:hypothetical protein [Cyanobium sp. WKJ7-Wakatipu]MCP9782163.1 hypothetical protein [Cyanobium sp. WKJ7-Wakatipu]